MQCTNRVTVIAGQVFTIHLVAEHRITIRVHHLHHRDTDFEWKTTGRINIKSLKTNKIAPLENFVPPIHRTAFHTPITTTR